MSRRTRALLRHLPQGQLLPEAVWTRRHRLVLVVAGVQAVLMGLAVGWRQDSPLLGTGVLLAIASPLAVAVPAAAGRQVRGACATLALLGTSITVVHLAGGVTEAHFHFFVMVGLAALYQDWVPFGVSLAVVLLHHAVIGFFAPIAVFGSQHSHGSALLWAVVHAIAVLAVACTQLASWRLNEQQGLHDALTGLANRLLLTEVTTRMLLQRDAEVSVLFLDLDDFKNVNDSRGHAAGDELLLSVTQRLLRSVRPGDEVARLGGDEFAIAVPGGPAVADQVAARVLAALRAPVTVGGHALVIHCSIGIAGTSTSADRRVETLLRDADLAMYLAKTSGKDQVVRYTPGLAEERKRQAELAEDLNACVAGQLADQLLVHYQAIVSLPSTRVSGHEALIRWQHPTRGLVPPDAFIPLAEESGAIVPVGAWVLRQATAQAVLFNAESTGEPMTMSVNVSPRQLVDGRFVDDVAHALRVSGLEPRLLTLEVTESVLVRDVEAAIQQLHELRALGVRIAIDDFGTGYSSLTYLKRLPADVVKIDRSFITDLGDGGAGETLVSSIIDLARSLHLDVVAEGVELPAQGRALSLLQCSHAQGYLYARPGPALDPPVTGAAPVAAPAATTAV